MKMKWNQKVVAMAMVVAMAVTGCGGSKKDATELLTKSATVMAEVKNMSAEMTMDMNMAMAGQEMNTTTKGTIVSFTEPQLKMKMDLSVAMTGVQEQNVQTQMYAQEADGTLVTYMNMNGSWYNTVADMETLSSYNAEENINIYLTAIKEPTVAGEEEVNGVATTKVTGVISGDEMEKMLEKSGALASAESMGVTAEQLKEIYAEVADMPIAMWIGEDGYVYKYEMDMGEMMQTIMDKVMEMAGADLKNEEQRMVISKALIGMTCSNYNTTEDFEIPAEALAAPVV